MPFILSDALVVSASEASLSTSKRMSTPGTDKHAQRQIPLFAIPYCMLNSCKQFLLYFVRFYTPKIGIFSEYLAILGCDAHLE